MAKTSSLKKYQSKRDFKKTSEPRGKRGKSNSEPIFVIQKHDATSLHYDFRLEVDGVLKSWAVPKGPSTNPREKRLAVPTEDHPMEYAGFEGVIPEGEYGGGPVIVWDNGTYRNTTEHKGEPVPMNQALDRGHATFELEGHKLQGEWALTRAHVGGGNRWLLVKMKDSAADARRKLVSSEPESVISGRTIEQVESEE